MYKNLFNITKTLNYKLFNFHTRFNLKVIGFTGMPGSGKTACSKFAQEKSIPVVRMGDLVWAEVENRGLELTDINVGTLATEERQKHGFGIWAERTVPVVLEQLKTSPTVIIDGIRGDAELKVFKIHFGDKFVNVAIHSNPKIRYDRIVKGRQRADDVMSEDEFKGRDDRELGWGIGNAIALADHIIVNEGTLDYLKITFLELLKKLGID
jgi:dephospho-CoA kinase